VYGIARTPIEGVHHDSDAGWSDHHHSIAPLVENPRSQRDVGYNSRTIPARFRDHSADALPY
jgi:hypothetical protein